MKSKEGKNIDIISQMQKKKVESEVKEVKINL